MIRDFEGDNQIKVEKSLIRPLIPLSCRVEMFSVCVSHTIRTAVGEVTLQSKDNSSFQVLNQYQ